MDKKSHLIHLFNVYNFKIEHVMVYIFTQMTVTLQTLDNFNYMNIFCKIFIEIVIGDFFYIECGVY